MEMMILAIFVVVYLGMILGGLPFFSLDRTGIALLDLAGWPEQDIFAHDG